MDVGRDTIRYLFVLDMLRGILTQLRAISDEKCSHRSYHCYLNGRLRVLNHVSSYNPFPGVVPRRMQDLMIVDLIFVLFDLRCAVLLCSIELVLAFARSQW